MTLRPNANLDILSSDDVKAALALHINAECHYRALLEAAGNPRLEDEITEATTPELRAINAADVFRTAVRYLLEHRIGAAVQAIAVDALIDAGVIPSQVYAPASAPGEQLTR